MENLIVMLNVLLSGMKGARRALLNHIIDELKEFSNDLIYTGDRLNEVCDENNTLRKGLADSTQRENELREELLPGFIDPTRYDILLRCEAMLCAKIPCIKAYRGITGADLKESKEAVETLIDSKPKDSSSFTSEWVTFAKNVSHQSMCEALFTLIKHGRMRYSDSENSDISILHTLSYEGE